MAIGNENQFENVGGEIGGSSFGASVFTKQPTVVYFKDIIPDYTSQHTQSSTDTNQLALLMKTGGFSSVATSAVTEGKIVESTSLGPQLYGKGSLLVKRPGLHLIKCKNRDKSSSQVCGDYRETGYICLETHASTSSGWYYIYISELGFGIEAISTYVDKDVKLPYYKASSATPKYYISTDSSGSAVNTNNYLGPAYTHDIPNFFVDGKMFTASIGKKYTTKDSNFRFNKEVDYTYEKKKDAKQFYMQKYCYLLFNNFNTTFLKGSTAVNALNVTRTETQVTISYKTYSKTIDLEDGDEICIYTRYPAEIKSTADYKGYFHSYADRDWDISWRYDIGTPYPGYVSDGDSTYPSFTDDLPNHKFGGEAKIVVNSLPIGSHEFKGGVPLTIIDGPEYDDSSAYKTSFVKSKTYEKTANISKADLDLHVYNGAFMSSGPGMDYQAQKTSTNLSTGSGTVNLTEDHTKHKFTLNYDYFLWETDEESFVGNQSAASWYSGASGSGDDNHFWICAHQIGRCCINEIGLIKGGYAKEKQVSYIEDIIGKENATLIPQKTPTGSFTYHGESFVNLDMETQSEYTEASYSQGEKPNVRGAFAHGLLLNTENMINGIQGNAVEYKIKTGYTDEPAIAIVLFSNNPNVTGLSNFNRRS